MQRTRFGIKDTALSLIDDSEEEEEEENKGLIVRAKGTTQPKALKEKKKQDVFKELRRLTWPECREQEGGPPTKDGRQKSTSSYDLGP